MTEDEAWKNITVIYNKEMDFEVPTCDECTGYGLGYGSVTHHLACSIAAAIPSATRVANDIWAHLGHEPRGEKK